MSLPSVETPCNVWTPGLTARWSSVNKQLLTCKANGKVDPHRPGKLEKVDIPPDFSAATTDLPADDFILRVRADVHHVRP